jgi:hypothetical protein
MSDLRLFQSSLQICVQLLVFMSSHFSNRKLKEWSIKNLSIRQRRLEVGLINLFDQIDSRSLSGRKVSKFRDHLMAD